MSEEKVPEWAKGIKLSKNFSLWELCRSEKHPDLVEAPSSTVQYWLQWWAQEALQPLRDEIGKMHIDSGYRNRKLNRAVGGELESSHQVIVTGKFKAVATDIVPLEINLDAAFRAIAKLKTLPIRGAIIYPKRGFIHIDSRDGVRTFWISTEPGKYHSISCEEALKFKI
ncbi:MAG: hypothetical protein HQM08_17325 [Candidatus Riflebacteria bacterium]|nr:hypothetical protein [Candidatus Riflebacteria bacterium]